MTTTMRRILNYIFHFLQSTQCLLLMLTLSFHVYLNYSNDKSNGLFIIFNQFSIFIATAAPLILLFFRAYSHSRFISFCALLCSVLFYLNAYFEVVDVRNTTGIYLSFLLFGSIFISLKTFIALQEIQQIKGFRTFPAYDCIEIAIISNFEDDYDVLDPEMKNFTKFKFYYKQCYAYGGCIYHNGEKHDFSHVNNYLNDQKIDINRLTSDDFKLIAMIFI